MRLQHRHPRSCFSPIITQQSQHPLKHTTFPLSALLSISIKPFPRPLQAQISSSSTTTFQSARQSRPRHQADSTQKISVSLLSNLFSSSSVSLSPFSLDQSSAMGRVCLDKIQSCRPRLTFFRVDTTRSAFTRFIFLSIFDRQQSS